MHQYYKLLVILLLVAFSACKRRDSQNSGISEDRQNDAKIIPGKCTPALKRRADGITYMPLEQELGETTIAYKEKIVGYGTTPKNLSFYTKSEVENTYYTVAIVSADSTIITQLPVLSENSLKKPCSKFTPLDLLSVSDNIASAPKKTDSSSKAPVISGKIFWPDEQGMLRPLPKTTVSFIFNRQPLVQARTDINNGSFVIEATLEPGKKTYSMFLLSTEYIGMAPIWTEGTATPSITTFNFVAAPRKDFFMLQNAGVFDLNKKK